MCGIFGFSFHDGQKETMPEGRRALLAYKLAELNDKRGGHSWGVTKIDGERFTIDRGLGALAEKPFHLLQAHTLMCHTRYATHGEKVIANAHPFEIGSIVGAHNGIFQNHYSLNRKYNREFAVDSMHAFAHLDEGRSFEDIEGYGSIEYFKRDNPSRIFLCQMRSGELAVAGIGKHPDPIGVVWTSSEDHLKEAMRACGIKKWFQYKIEREQVFYVEAGGLHYATGQTLKLTAPEVYSHWSGGHYDSKLGIYITATEEAQGWASEVEWKNGRRTKRIHILDNAKFEKYMQDLDKKSEDQETRKLLMEKSNVLDKDEQAIKEWDDGWEGRMRGEQLAIARARIQAAADLGDSECTTLIRDLDSGKADAKDLILAIECGLGIDPTTDVPTPKEEKEEITKVLQSEIERDFPGSHEKFQSDMEAMRERWERLARAEETGRIDPRDEDIALWMRGR